VRKPGPDRKKTTEKDPTLLPDVQALVEATTRGDPESPLLWTARSQRNLVAALRRHGHQTSMKMVARLLKDDLGYSLQANRKRLESAQHSGSERAIRAHQRNHPAATGGARAGRLGGHEEEGARRAVQERRARAARRGQSRGRARA
jgi:hypothetical protein